MNTLQTHCTDEIYRCMLQGDKRNKLYIINDVVILSTSRGAGFYYNKEWIVAWVEGGRLQKQRFLKRINKRVKHKWNH